MDCLHFLAIMNNYSMNIHVNIFVTVLVLVQYCLDYSSFVVSFEIEKFDSSNFVHFPDYFGYFFVRLDGVFALIF